MDGVQVLQTINNELDIRPMFLLLDHFGYYLRYS